MSTNQYHAEPTGTFDRRRAYLDYCAAHSPGGRTGFFSQIGRLELGLDVDETPFYEALTVVDKRVDCCDFTVGGLLRVLYLYRESPHIRRELVAAIEARILAFKYWWDEEQGDNRRCYWTENHQIIFHSDELLAAQLFPDAVFSNSGKDAAYHREHALHLIRRWFDFRARFGFSEWLSNCYFEEDLLALVNLHDFVEDAEIRDKAKACIDLLLLEMALHTHRGVMGCTHGRTYTRLIKGARREDASNTALLLFGMGSYNNPASLGTVPLATSRYRCPPVFAAIAADLGQPRVFKERHSIEIADAPRYGLRFDDPVDGHLFWSIQDYIHESIYDLAQETRRAYGVMLYEDYLQRYFQVWNWQVEEYGRVTDRNIDCHGMTEVHIQTYRTGAVLLSSAQSFRPGKPGYQQHPWQATLGIDAVVFTNHPGSDDEWSRPNFWAGNGILPRVAQHENVLICIHHLPPDDRYPFSHGYFPRARFDEVVEHGHWVFGRKGDGYIGIYSQTAPRWLADQHDDAHSIVELRADASTNVWIVEVGDAARHGSFAGFVAARSEAAVTVDDLDVWYASPSVGVMEFGWRGPLQIDGVEIALHDYPRFDNPYCRAEFGARSYRVEFDREQYEFSF